MRVSHDAFRPFWLERFNALSGQYSGLERELSGGVFGDVLLEPVSVPRDLTVSSDAGMTRMMRLASLSHSHSSSLLVPNILLRSKLAPEVTASVQEAVPLVIDETRKKLYRSTVRMLQERFAQIQEELQGAVAEQTSALLADALTTPSMLSRAMESRLSAASLGSHPTSKVASLTSSIDSVSTTGAMAVDDREAFLETAIRWLYTGQQ